MPRKVKRGEGCMSSQRRSRRGRGRKSLVPTVRKRVYGRSGSRKRRQSRKSMRGGFNEEALKKVLDAALKGGALNGARLNGGQRGGSRRRTKRARRSRKSIGGGDAPAVEEGQSNMVAANTVSAEGVDSAQERKEALNAALGESPFTIKQGGPNPFNTKPPDE